MRLARHAWMGSVVMLYASVLAAAQPAPAQPTPMPMQGMGCDQMMQMDGMMSPSAMHTAMTVGYVVGVLVAAALIFALVALGIFLLRRSQAHEATLERPLERPSGPLRDARAST